MPPSEIRSEAREALKGKWGKAACITLIYLGISLLVSLIQKFALKGSPIYNILQIAYIVIDIPLSFGLIVSFIKLKKGDEVSAFDFIKEGFSRFGKSWGITWHTFIRLLLPIICFILIVILQFVLMLTGVAVQLGVFFSLLYVALLIATIIYIACRGLLYTLAYYISFDNPDLSSKECVLKSAEYMTGNRGNYLMLELSFIGWIILAALTFSIGMLWVLPYMQVAAVCFYERVINNKKVEK